MPSLVAVSMTFDISYGFEVWGVRACSSYGNFRQMDATH